jgi:hypothetical protein
MEFVIKQLEFVVVHLDGQLLQVDVIKEVVMGNLHLFVMILIVIGAIQL